MRSLIDASFYNIDVANHSALPILNVVLERAVLRGSAAHWKTDSRYDPVIRLVQPATETAPPSFVGEFFQPDGSPIATGITDRLGNMTYPEKPDEGLVTATTTFTDAGGNTWRTDTDGHLTHMGTAD